MNKYFKWAMAFLLTGLCSSAFAQMSTSQIVSYVKERSAAGADKQKIALELLQKGVTEEQLKRLNASYSAVGDSASLGDRTSDSASRLRQNNGEEPGPIPYDSYPVKVIFGHDVFRDRNLSFAPNMNIPTPQDYVLGAGDEVILDIYGGSQLSHTCKISPDGSIYVPDEGIIFISGLTSSQAQEKVRQAIGANYADSQIRLTVGQTRTIVVHVLGEVMTPGTYSVAAFSNVFNALYLSGGINDIGTMRDVRVSRGGKVIAHVDIYDFILNGNLTGNVILQDNDVIIVDTYRNLVRIDGKVRRPMYYELKPGETLARLLEFSGGFTGEAYRDRIRIERRSQDGLTVHNISKDEFGAFQQEDGDVAVVQSVIERFRNTASISGAVFRPGKYKLDERINSVRTLVEQAGGLEEKAVTSLAVILRLLEDRRLETVPVPLGDILAGKSEDIMLQNEDSLIIASTFLRDSLQILRIEGEVFHPGQYSFSRGETVSTLITRAGGLKESAFLTDIEVSRRVTEASDDPDGRTLSRIFHVNLDAGLGLSGDTDMTLEPFDVVSVKRSPSYKDQKRVFVTGEVNKAGAYVLASSQERISDLIQRAGGLTVNAFTGGAQLTRRMRKNDVDLLYRELEIATTAQDSIQVQKRLMQTDFLVGFDLDAALLNPGSSNDLMVMENDSIFIPTLDNTVKISGEVLSPSTVNYEAGKSLSFYLNQAGGVSKTGSRRQAYVIYANGKKSRASKADILPGSEIVVPVKVKKELNPQATSMWLSAASTMASFALIISNILRK